MSSGQVLLAFQPATFVQRYLGRHMEAFTPRTLTSAEALVDRMRAIRRDGYTWALEEFDEGISSVAAPVADAGGEVVAAVHVHGPSYRFPPKGSEAGLADQVDFHTWKLLKGVALATVLGVGSELVFGSSDSDLVKALQQSTQATTNRAGQRLIERQLNVQPTITVRPGWPLRVIVHKDIVLRPYRASTPN